MSTDDGVRAGGGDPVSDSAAGRQVGGGRDQQWRQEVKIAPASRPSSLVPGQDLGSGPGAILGPGRVTILGGRSPPSQAAVVPAQPTEEGREGPEREEERPGKWGQAEV